MCLLLLAFHAVPSRPWLLLGNRDEFHARATAAAAAWAGDPHIVGGRDLEAGGSWLALNRNGRFAAVTNVRSGAPRRGARSRGELVAGFVCGDAAPGAYAATVARHRDDYGPFNLIVGDSGSAWGASSLLAEAWPMASGVHVLSNGPPAASWPKVRRLDDAFRTMLQSGELDNSSPSRGAAAAGADAGQLDLLADSSQPADSELPDTGVGIEIERRLGPVFIRGALYGTRASTLAYANADGGLVLVERRFGPDGIALGETRIAI